MSAKVSVFQQDQVNYHRNPPKGFAWHLIERKAITHKNSRYKCWVVSQQALFFNAFLARHDDFNDAHIKDKN